MFKPLERRIAVVVADAEANAFAFAGGSFLSGFISELGADSTVYSVSEIATLDVAKFEALLIAEIEIERGSNIELTMIKLLRRFHLESKPIATIGRSVKLVAKTFGERGIELTTGEDSAVTILVTQYGAIHTDCRADDYISDRENKTLSTPGSLHSDKADAKTGVHKMLRELIEMA